jgi:molecular chaperone GrpE (heat shock protein)
MNRAREKKSSKELIGEMMLAKTVLEEKNELLDQKESIIRELRTEVRTAESELERLRREVEKCYSQSSSIRQSALQEGFSQVITGVVHLLADYLVEDTDTSMNLAIRLLRLFEEKYGLEVIEESPERVDPRIHQVVAVEYDPGAKLSIQVLARGFRLGGKTIVPALVKVIRTTNSESAYFGVCCPGKSFVERGNQEIRSPTCCHRK